MNTFYAWTQEELPKKFYNINQSDTKLLGDLDYVGKRTSDMKEAMMAYLGDVDNDEDMLLPSDG
jgi:hypothetical protein